MYSLDCSYYKKEFNSIDELIDDVITSGMDPNYEITHDGETTGEMLADLIVHQSYTYTMKSPKHTSEQRREFVDVQKRMTERVYKSKKQYTRKPKHKVSYKEFA